MLCYDIVCDGLRKKKKHRRLRHLSGRNLLLEFSRGISVLVRVRTRAIIHWKQRLWSIDQVLFRLNLLLKDQVQKNRCTGGPRVVLVTPYSTPVTHGEICWIGGCCTKL